jgi:hypothetical protein
VDNADKLWKGVKIMTTEEEKAMRTVVTLCFTSLLWGSASWLLYRSFHNFGFALIGGFIVAALTLGAWCVICYETVAEFEREQMRQHVARKGSFRSDGFGHAFEQVDSVAPLSRAKGPGDEPAAGQVADVDSAAQFAVVNVEAIAGMPAVECRRMAKR